MAQPNTGWGGQKWGQDPWGGALGAAGNPVVLTGAFAPVENVVRMEFNVPPFFSGLLEPDDASNPSHFQVLPVAGSVGRDGTAARSVTVVQVQVGEDPASLDLFLDRPMTPSPALYTVNATGLTDSTVRAPMIPGPPVQFLALFKVFSPPNPQTAKPSRDFANPQDGTLQQVPNAPLLGTFNVDDTGDYAVDEGLASIKKRVLRVLVTSVGGFLHLPGYGVGIRQHGKRLASASLRAKIAADAQAQIQKDPDVASCVVTATTLPSFPKLVFFNVRVQTRTGQSFRATVPTAT